MSHVQDPFNFWRGLGAVVVAGVLELAVPLMERRAQLLQEIAKAADEIKQIDLKLEGIAGVPT